MKHFIDIERLKEKNTDLTRRNDLAFVRGDFIQISEKIDGSNASIKYNSETKTYDCFSRKQQLDFNNTLGGFWNYIQNWAMKNRTTIPERYVVFGEWCRKNKIRYNDDWYGRWIVYDIWDEYSETWLLQSEVKLLCKIYDLEYIHVLYEGPFISWDHCRKYCHSPAYGPTQEGIVVKNQSKLAETETDIRTPVVLKIVNEEFSEVMKVREPRVEDPLFTQAKELALQIVTERRVEKMIYKLRDEGVLPEILSPTDMKTVAKNLPKRVFEDCIKEEPEIVAKMGEYGGKVISSSAIQVAKSIILGDS